MLGHRGMVWRWRAGLAVLQEKRRSCKVPRGHLEGPVVLHEEADACGMSDEKTKKKKKKRMVAPCVVEKRSPRRKWWFVTQKAREYKHMGIAAWQC